DLRAAGYHPFPMPLGILLGGEGAARGPCVRCATCGGFPCRVGAKADAQTICVEPALRHANVEMLTGALVRRLETSPSGREITSVHVERRGEIERYSAGIVVVSAGAVN